MRAICCNPTKSHGKKPEKSSKHNGKYFFLPLNTEKEISATAETIKVTVL